MKIIKLAAICLVMFLVMMMPRTPYVGAEASISINNIYNSSQLVTSGLLRNMWIEGHYLYLCEEGNWAISVWDVSNPALPVKINSISTTGGPLDIKGNGQYLYVSVRDNLVVLDITNPITPVIVGQAYDTGWLHGIYLLGDYVYAANFSSDRLVVFDVGDPTNPVIVSQVTNSTLNGAHDVVVEYPFAYVTSHYGSAGDTFTGEITQVDISNPTSPRIVWVSPEKSQYAHIVKKGEYIFAGGSLSAVNYLYAWDISTTTPVFKGKVRGGYGYWIATYSDYAFVASGDWLLVVLDIADPSNMTWITNLSQDGVRNIRNVVIYGNYFYVASGDKLHGFEIVGVEPPAPPEEPPPPELPPPEPSGFPIEELINNNVHIHISGDVYMVVFPEEEVEGTTYKVLGIIFRE